MNECPRCKNEEISNSANYCKICGLRLNTATAETAAAIKKLCVICKERQGQLQCTDTEWVCEHCSQVMSELAET